MKKIIILASLIIFLVSLSGCIEPKTSTHDADNDGIPNAQDNCPSVSNPGQTDSDNDGIGDSCEEIEPEPEPETLCSDLLETDTRWIYQGTIREANSLYTELQGGQTLTWNPYLPTEGCKKMMLYFCTDFSGKNGEGTIKLWDSDGRLIFIRNYDILNKQFVGVGNYDGINPWKIEVINTGNSILIFEYQIDFYKI